MLGPAIGPLGRVVRGGRNWEGKSPFMSLLERYTRSDTFGTGYSIDPYLSGALVYETVVGTQEAGVITSTKVCPCLACTYIWTLPDRVSAFHRQRARNRP